MSNYGSRLTIYMRSTMYKLELISYFSYLNSSIYNSQVTLIFLQNSDDCKKHYAPAPNQQEEMGKRLNDPLRETVQQFMRIEGKKTLQQKPSLHIIVT